MARGKKSWRKKKAVLEEQYLVDRQDDALLGSLTETADKDLFLIDRGGNRQSSSQVSSGIEPLLLSVSHTPLLMSLLLFLLLFFFDYKQQSLRKKKESA